MDDTEQFYSFSQPDSFKFVVNHGEKVFYLFLIIGVLFTQQELKGQFLTDVVILVSLLFLILVPAFITSQLKDAFEIGVLIYLPFFVIDLVVSNILLAMGMMMMSPLTIALPLKLFLLVVLDGWTLLTQGLVLTFK